MYAVPEGKVHLTRHEQVFLITMRGEMDHDDAEDVEAAWAAAGDAASPMTAVDLSRVTFADSMLLNALLDARRRHLADGRELVLIGPSTPRCGGSSTSAGPSTTSGSSAPALPGELRPAARAGQSGGGPVRWSRTLVIWSMRSRKSGRLSRNRVAPSALARRWTSSRADRPEESMYVRPPKSRRMPRSGGPSPVRLPVTASTSSSQVS